MTQDTDLDGLVRQRIRGLRTARGWSLDDLAARCYLSPSTLSRIETGHRRIALDQLAPIARALGTTLDQLVESADDEDVVIRPHRDVVRGVTTWLLSREPGPHGVTVAKMRITRPAPHGPGRTESPSRQGLVHGPVRDRRADVGGADHRGRGRPGGGILHHDSPRGCRPRRPGGDPVHPRPRRPALPSPPFSVIVRAGRRASTIRGRSGSQLRASHPMPTRSPQTAGTAGSRHAGQARHAAIPSTPMSQ